MRNEKAGGEYARKFSDGKFDWYVTDKEIWYLDYKKRSDAYKKIGFDMGEDEDGIEDERQDLLILNSDLYVNFDTHQLFSLYSEPASYEDYVPLGWEGEYLDFMELIPENQRYWMRDSYNELLMEEV